MKTGKDLKISIGGKPVNFDVAATTPEELYEYVRLQIQNNLKEFLFKRNQPETIAAIKAKLNVSVQTLIDEGRFAEERPDFDVQVDAEDPNTVNVVPLNEAGRILLLWLQETNPYE